jgi:hypothetical protein
MRRPGAGITIRDFMIAVAVLAGLLAPPFGDALVRLTIASPGFALIGTRWLPSQSQRRLAGFCFWISLPLAYEVLGFLRHHVCSEVSLYSLAFLAILWLFAIVSVIPGDTVW